MSQDQGDDRVVVVTPQGMGSASAAGHQGSADQNSSGGQQGQAESQESNPIELVEQPAKVMRIGSMIKQLLEEVRGAPLDEAGRARLMEIHRRSISELEQGLAPELVEELERITLPFGTETPTDAELRIAQAQLVGWLEGLFHGIQTALVAQQMAARMQLEGMRHQLPPGVSGGPGPGGVPGYVVEGQGAPGQRRDASEDPSRQTGQYL